MSQLAQPVVVHHTVVTCDQTPDHEFDVVTDGYKAYAVSTDGAVETEAFHRLGTGVSADCPCRREYGGDDEACMGRITVDLATGGWSADAKALALFRFATTRIES